MVAKKKVKSPSAAVTMTDATLANAGEASIEPPGGGRFSRRIAITTIIVALVVALIPVLYDMISKRLNRPRSPEFFVATSNSLSPDAAIISPEGYVDFIAANDDASQDEDLYIEFDGIPIGKLKRSRIGKFTWTFWPGQYPLSPEMRAPGTHDVVLKFLEEGGATRKRILFDTSEPEASIRISPGDDPTEKLIEGNARDQDQGGDIYVDILFNLADSKEVTKIPLEVKKTGSSDGVAHYEFGARISGLPEYDESDPRYSEPFFAIRIRDQAGHEYFNGKSFAKFMAPGEEVFSSSGTTFVTMKPVSLEYGQIIVDFNLESLAASVADGDVGLNLKVAAYGASFNRLSWTRLSDQLEGASSPVVVVRDGQRLAVALGDGFVDIAPPTPARYRIYQEGKDGRVYESNEVSIDAAVSAEFQEDLRLAPLDPDSLGRSLQPLQDDQVKASMEVLKRDRSLNQRGRDENEVGGPEIESAEVRVLGGRDLFLRQKLTPGWMLGQPLIPIPGDTIEIVGSGFGEKEGDVVACESGIDRNEVSGCWGRLRVQSWAPNVVRAQVGPDISGTWSGGITLVTAEFKSSNVVLVSVSGGL